MAVWKSNLEPSEIMRLAEAVKKGYLEEHKDDSQIAEDLQIHPHAAYQLRKLLGLARRHGNIFQDLRRIDWNDKVGFYRIGGIPLTDCFEKLGMKPGKAYCWHALEPKTVKFKGEEVGLLTLEIKLMSAKGLKAREVKKEASKRRKEVQEE